MRLLGAAVLAAVVGVAGAQEKVAPQHGVLVELFTSEGCSSCPPADRLLTQLQGKRTAAGDLVVVLSEHVTYWNRLGWTDPFSGDIYTQRQEAYGQRFRIEGVYTPQMVVNGEAEMVGSDGQAVLKALQAAGKGAAVSLSVDGASLSGNKLAVSYTVAGDAPKGAEVWAVIADDMASSKVLTGENGGKTIAHVAVARSLMKLGGAGGVGMASLEVPGVVAGEPKTGRHVVLFVQERGQGKVLAVGSRML